MEGKLVQIKWSYSELLGPETRKCRHSSLERVGTCPYHKAHCCRDSAGPFILYADLFLWCATHASRLRRRELQCISTHWKTVRASLCEQKEDGSNFASSVLCWTLTNAGQLLGARIYILLKIAKNKTFFWGEGSVILKVRNQRCVWRI